MLEGTLDKLRKKWKNEGIKDEKLSEEDNYRINKR